MTPPAAILRQDWVGEFLFGAVAQALPGQRPTSLSLHIGTRWLHLGSSDEEPRLHVALDQRMSGSDKIVTDLFPRDPFARFRHCPLYSWWLMENEQGVQDGLLLLFDRADGVMVLAQPGWLEFLAVSRACAAPST